MKLALKLSSIVFTSMTGIALYASNSALGATDFDLSPEQHGRIRAEQDVAATKAIPQSFSFVAKDTLTIGIVPAHPPISTYATDAKTVVGFDPDLAQLVADSL